MKLARASTSHRVPTERAGVVCQSEPSAGGSGGEAHRTGVRGLSPGIIEPVPTYEFRCRACGNTFEQTRPMSQASDPATCPHGHDDTVKLLSTVAVGGRAGSPGPGAQGAGGGGGCCGGACGCGR